ncbi:MAG: hypothetical protein H7Y17_05720 [Chlorobia bacterium]|nr:hypothetical protein [Fimbriimonadaceae bacterium]
MKLGERMHQYSEWAKSHPVAFGAIFAVAVAIGSVIPALVGHRDVNWLFSFAAGLVFGVVAGIAASRGIMPSGD